MMMSEIYGIDISTAQGEINWNDLARNPNVSFVIIRAAQGISQDSRFDHNIEDCQDAGIPFGLYFASSASTVSGCEKEADVAINYAKAYNPRYGLWFDFEGDSRTKLGKPVITQCIKAWLDKVSAAGYECGWYTNRNWMLNLIDYDQLLPKYRLWYAAYPSTAQKKITDCPKDNRQKLSFPQASIWQWSDNGRVDGLTKAVDLNVCYDDFPETTEELGYITLAEAKEILTSMGYAGIVI